MRNTFFTCFFKILLNSTFDYVATRKVKDVFRTDNQIIECSQYLFRSFVGKRK